MFVSDKELTEIYKNDLEIIRNWSVKVFKADTVLYKQMGLILRDYKEGSESKFLGSEYMKLMEDFKAKTDKKTKFFSIRGIHLRNRKIIVSISRKDEIDYSVMYNIG
ncbi:MAG: hypothetical protein HZC47_01000 [Methanobacterium sp.]|uniref:hypothetical protein n=1 Tax=Methanobacterium sp. TaxID=2164 RepID=UPI003D662162|nr:hypothetical protein [Methanobacterium sp.]